MYNDVIRAWLVRLRIEGWTVSTNKIDPGSVDYNDQDYFIGIGRDFENKTGVIYHDIDLVEESIVHELMHIKYVQLPNQSYEDYERFIVYKTEMALALKDKLVYSSKGKYL
jgi:hypothetical protein